MELWENAFGRQVPSSSASIRPSPGFSAGASPGLSAGALSGSSGVGTGTRASSSAHAPTNHVHQDEENEVLLPHRGGNGGRDQQALILVKEDFLTVKKPLVTRDKNIRIFESKT